ncbi:hypothetical protein Ccrd_010962 [Cynara cardunculus var. scolymus]|uniref:Uncharacterized protein n=1 Tax=Cynara cardunculus var. scolymus TaxID=59895 RepID=A0A124SHU3_CYNCS|nr:hypothetical protein Ccrd_010962 [Cynara cardunculus var. scolymus]
MFLHDHVMVSAVAALYRPFVLIRLRWLDLSDNIICGIKPDDSESRPYAPDTYFFGYPILLMILNPDLFTLLFFISILPFKHFVEIGRSAHWGREKFPESALTSDIGNLKVLILPKFRVNPLRINHLMALDYIFPSGNVYCAAEQNPKKLLMVEVVDGDVAMDAVIMDIEEVVQDVAPRQKRPRPLRKDKLTLKNPNK